MSDNKPIPFLDLVTPHQLLKAELMEVFERALGNAGFIGGPAVQKFEEDFARYCDAGHGVGVADGTTALRLAFLACGIRPGDVMVTVAHTFIATAEAISQVGARPVFVDIDEATFNLDPAQLQKYIDTQCEFHAEAGELREKKSGARVSAVVPVHLYGQPADMDAILAIAERYHLMVIEDACQAHGAEYFSKRENRWRRCGSMGKAAAFSFYPGKNLGACGEAGAVTTNDAEVARKVRVLRDHGQSQKYIHEVEGYNGRLDAIQAGILGVKLPHLPAWTEQRRAAAKRYDELLDRAKGPVQRPVEAPWAKHVYHLYVVRVSEREQLQKHLGAHGIGTGIHYPIPLHQQLAYAHLGYTKGSLPVTERVAPEIVSLPMFPGLAAPEQERVVERVLEFALQRA